MSELVVEVDIRNKRYGQDVVLGAIRFDIYRGERVALCGPSGIGKSTLLRILAGIDQQYQGNIRVNGKIGMVFQEPTLLSWRNALDNITIIAGADEQAARKVLAECQLDGKELLYPGQLSLGQQRRLALARAIASRPDFLVLDEPFASLDAALVDDMLALARSVIANHAMTTLIVTHSMREAEGLGARILRLEGKPAVLAD